MDGSLPQGAGEVPKPSGRTYSDPLNGMRQAGFGITLDNPRANYILQNDCMCKFYRMDRNGNWNLMLNGDVLSAQEDGEGNVGQINVVVVDPLFRLQRRLIGMALGSNNQATGFTIGTPTVPIDLSLAVSQVLSQVNTSFYSGIAMGTIQNCGTTGVAGPLYAVFAAPTIQQICATLGGPDFWIQPLEPSGAMPNTTIGQMNVGFARGTNRPNAIFEYGTGKKNVNKYTRILTKQGACNQAWSLPPGWPTGINAGDSVASYGDTTSQNTISRYEDIASTDVANLGLRTILCQEMVTVRKQRQQQITFTPNTNVGIDYGTDYTCGDVVTARAFDVKTQTMRFNGMIRVYGVALAMSDTEEETATLTLITDTVSGGLTYSGALG